MTAVNNAVMMVMMISRVADQGCYEQPQSDVYCFFVPMVF